MTRAELAREIVYGTPLCEVMALMTALDHWDAMLHAERMATAREGKR